MLTCGAVIAGNVVTRNINKIWTGTLQNKQQKHLLRIFTWNIHMILSHHLTAVSC